MVLIFDREFTIVGILSHRLVRLDVLTRSNDSKKVSDTQAETNSSSQINDNNDNEEDSNSDDLDEDKPDPYSFESDEDENANNSTLGDDGEESIKAEEIEDPAGVR